MRGKFIVFEGLDASGKETQAKKLVDYLKSKGIEAIYTDEPTSTNPIGKFIKDWLSKKFDISSPHSIPLLFAADRYEHISSIIKPYLEKGTWVVCDRYFYSTIAYETAILNGGDEIINWIVEMHRFVLKPDIVIYLDVSPEESVRRKPLGDRLEKLEMQKKVKEIYYKIKDRFNFYVVDGEREIENVFEDVKKIVENEL